MNKSTKRIRRQGASLLEITGLLVAVGIGVWLGARYLGVDLHAAAYTALTKADLMEKLPEEWQLAPPEGMEPQTPEQEALALTAELEAIRLDVARLNNEEIAGEELTDEQALEASANLDYEMLARRQNTLAFWSQLGGIRDEVDRLQASADEALNEQNVYKILEVRRRAYVYGAKAVKLAMEEAVDPQAIQFAEQLMGWFDHGAELYGEAMRVWEGQHLAAQGVSSDQLLEQVQLQHDNEALLLFQKGGRLREVLFRRYQVAFPEIEDGTIR